MKRPIEWIKLFMRSPKARRLTILGAILGMVVAAVPSIAWASTTPVKGNTTANPGASSDVTSTADCGNGNVVMGGGITESFSPDGNMSGNAQRVEGTGPSTDGTNYVASTTTNARYWLGVDGTGGMSDPDGGATAYAICDTGISNTGGTQIITDTEPYPSTSLSAVPVHVTCSGTYPTLVSGGGYSSPPNGAMKVIAEYPYSSGNGQFPPEANPAGSGTPDSWAAIGWVGGSGGAPGDFTTVWAVCAKSTTETATVVTAHDTGPGTSGSTSKKVTVQCPAGKVLAGGGYSVDANNLDYDGSHAFSNPSSGDHANGSYPVNSLGNVWTSGAATGWAATGHSGGATEAQAYTHAFAMCWG